MAEGHPLVEPLRPWDPERIGGYLLLGRLGAGAMGRVYLGRSAAGRLVAVKTIRAEFAEEPDFRTRFANEVTAARRVSGAFTAPVIAADPEADVPWLATAYVPAPPLSTLVQECGPLPVPAVRWLAAGCAEALESIHGVGLVHRDLKPSNVLVSADGPRVIDFGVARAVERIALTMTRGAVGTPAYMAPEQARDTSRATTVSDVYSLGATILFAATGHGPYQGDSVMDVLVHLATEEPDLGGLPADLMNIVVACLERDPRRRPTSASVLAYLASSDGAPHDDFGRAPLPPRVRALMEQYRQDPRPASQPGAQADPDGTFGSLPPPAQGRKGTARHSAPPRAPAPEAPVPAGASTSGARRRQPRPAAPWRGRVLAAAGSALAVALVGAGLLIGSHLAARPQGKASGRQGTRTTRSQGFNPALNPPPGQAPPLVTSPPSDPSGRPLIVMTQPLGDPRTIFVIEGRGWLPGSHLTVALKTVSLQGIRASPVHPPVDGVGSFNYAVNQDHEFFRDGLPPGLYTVVVTGPHRSRATAKFRVLGPPPGAPGGPPPPP